MNNTNDLGASRRPADAQPREGSQLDANERRYGIVYSVGNAWVYRSVQAGSYTVYWQGITHSTPDSTYRMNADGLSIAKARADYLAKCRPITWYPATAQEGR